MRKYVLAALLSATVIPAFAFAAADNFFFKPYVGTDYQYTYMDYTNAADGLFSSSLHGVNGHVGARIHQYFGIEGGYLWTGEAGKDNISGSGLNTRIRLHGFNADLLGYLPVGTSKRFELIGTIGGSYLTANVRASGAGFGTGSDSEWKPRFGAGAQYWLTDKLNLRGIVRYQDANFSGLANEAITANIGINYQF